MDKGRRAGHVIAIGNQKGGVGKTTNTVHIAAALGQGGRSCLIIDLDPHAGSTKHLGLQPASYAGTLELLTTDETVAGLLVEEGMPKGVHLIPSRIHLADLDLMLNKFVDKTTILDRPLKEARPMYDYILLDTGPGAGDTTTIAAYSSADWFLLSAFAQPLSIEGLTDAFRDIADVRTRRNPGLEVAGVVFSNIDRRAKVLRRQLVSTVDQALPGRKFSTSISQAIMLPEVSGRGVTVFQVPKFRDSPTAGEYIRLAAELDHRVNNREAFLAGTLAPADMLIWDDEEGDPERAATTTPAMNTGGDDGQTSP